MVPFQECTLLVNMTVYAETRHLVITFFPRTGLYSQNGNFFFYRHCARGQVEDNLKGQEDLSTDWGTYVEIRGHPMKQKTNRGLFLFERTVGGPGYT